MDPITGPAESVSKPKITAAELIAALSAELRFVRETLSDITEGSLPRTSTGDDILGVSDDYAKTRPTYRALRHPRPGGRKTDVLGNEFSTGGDTRSWSGGGVRSPEWGDPGRSSEPEAPDGPAADPGYLRPWGDRE